MFIKYSDAIVLLDIETGLFYIEILSLVSTKYQLIISCLSDTPLASANGN